MAISQYITCQLNNYKTDVENIETCYIHAIGDEEIEITSFTNSKHFEVVKVKGGISGYEPEQPFNPARPVKINRKKPLLVKVKWTMQDNENPEEYKESIIIGNNAENSTEGRINCIGNFKEKKIEITSIFPTEVVPGHEYDIDIKGSGFKENTNVSFNGNDIQIIRKDLLRESDGTKYIRCKIRIKPNAETNASREVKVGDTIANERLNILKPNYQFTIYKERDETTEFVVGKHYNVKVMSSNIKFLDDQTGGKFSIFKFNSGESSGRLNTSITKIRKRDDALVFTFIINHNNQIIEGEEIGIVLKANVGYNIKQP